jgi:small subunit ribosomal protein S16
MALRIRLRRMGRKKAPHYRIVVAESSMPRDGRFVETVGHYNPRTEPMTLVVHQDKAREWLRKGAKPTETVESLFRRSGVYAPPAASTIEAVAETVRGAASQAADAASRAASAVAGAVAGAAATVRERVAGAADTAADTASAAAETVSDAASAATETVSEAASAAAETVSDAASAATETVSEAASSAAEAATETSTETAEQVGEADAGETGAEAAEGEERPA